MSALTYAHLNNVPSASMDFTPTSPDSPVSRNDSVKPVYGGSESLQPTFPSTTPPFQPISSTSTQFINYPQTPNEMDPFSKYQQAHSNKQVSFNLPAGIKTIEFKEKESPKSPQSVHSILNDLSSLTEAKSTDSQKAIEIEMDELMKHDSGGSIVVNGNRSESINIFIPSKTHHNPQQPSDPDIVNIEITEEDKMRYKYLKMKEKLAALKKSYRKTKNLRANNEKLSEQNAKYERQMVELQKKLKQQKATIIEQNKHLIKLSAERDDFEDVVEEQRRFSKLYGINGSPVLQPLNSKNRSDDLEHLRSNTQPFSLTAKMNKFVDEDDDEWHEDDEFTMSHYNELRQMDDTYKSDDDVLSDEEEEEEEEDEEKYVSVSTITPGGNSFKTKGQTPGGQNVLTPNGSNKPEVDDITLDVERYLFVLSECNMTASTNKNF